MKITGLRIGDTSFTVDSFADKTFREAFQEQCNSLINGTGAETIIAEVGFNLLTSLQSPRSLDIQEQITLTSLAVRAKLTIISEGESGIPSSDEIRMLHPEDLVDIITCNKSMQEIEGMIRCILKSEDSTDTSQKEKFKIELLHTIEGTNYGIYSGEENDGTTYYVCDKKKNGTGKGFIVDDCGKKIDSLSNRDEVYCLINTIKGSEIWYGSIEDGFTKVKQMEGSEMEGGLFYARDTIGIDDDGIIILENLFNGKEVFNIEKKYLIQILFVHNGLKQTIVYLAYDDDGEARIFVTDEEYVGEYIFCVKNESKMHKYINGVVIIEFNKDTQEYTLYDSNSGEKISRIQCFKDLKGGVFNGGETHAISQGDGNLMFSFSSLNDEGQVVESVFDTSENDINSDLITSPKKYTFPEDMTQYKH